MTDPINGKTIFIGWAPHELIWLDAALRLPAGERTSAYQQIASMTGRSLGAVEYRAYRLRQERVKAQVDAAKENPRQIMVPAQDMRRARRVSAMPSAFTVDKKRLMAGRA